MIGKSEILFRKILKIQGRSVDTYEECFERRRCSEAGTSGGGGGGGRCGHVPPEKFEI